MEKISFSYREVFPDNASQGDYIEIVLNTGGTHSTLQDIKVTEKSGGFCFKNINLSNRNRFIYWRTYQDILELTELSLDYNLHQNRVRFKFTDSPVLSVLITEHESCVSLLVATVCSLHRINFPRPDDLTVVGSSTNSTSIFNLGEIQQSFSIFRDINASIVRNPTSFYVIDTSGASNSPVPYAASCYIALDGEFAYYALATHCNLNLYIMNISSGHTTVHQLKENNIMPRLISNLKGAFIGKSDSSDSEHAVSMVFNNINDDVYLLVLYRNDIIRLWSSSTMQIICSINCVRDATEQRLQGPQGNILRKITDTSACAFLSHSAGSEFVCIDINVDNTNSVPILMRRKVIAAPQLDLADFVVCESRIWALWSNAEGEFSISNFALTRGLGSGMNWVSAAMESPPDRYCAGVEQGMDPREAYCSYIFHPGKFECSVIMKALLMFRRSTVHIGDKHCSITILKQQVCQAVEDEIQNETKDFNISDDEFLEISNRLWERFYSCCEQYHIKSCQPTGLFILDPIDGVCVVKKNAFSLLRPCEMLEHLMLTAGEISNSNVFVQEGRVEFQDLVNLIAVISQLEKWLPEEIKIDLDKKLYQLEIPNFLIGQLIDDILAGDPDKEILPRNFIVTLRQMLQTIKDVRTSISLLLDFLRINSDNFATMQSYLDLTRSVNFLTSIGSLFGSEVGLSVLSETVRQIAMTRFAMCRNLLILLQILIDTHSLPVDVLESLRSQFMPEAVLFLQSYYVMVWITETTVSENYSSSLESSMQRLNMLQLTDGSQFNFFTSCKNPITLLLRFFLQSKGLCAALGIFGKNVKEVGNYNWQNTLIPLSIIVCQLTWAVSFNFFFGEWLFGTCQHIIIEDYVRLLNNWCEWNICSRQFMLAVSLLDSGESYKAYDLFLQSAKGIESDLFLSNKILKQTPETKSVKYMVNFDSSIENVRVGTRNQAIAQYYLKVIQLFEQHNSLDHIISLAQVAIGLLDDNDPQLPMFQSIAFNNHLQLEHYEEAYHSLIYNAEMSRRKDCLRQLVVTLFNYRRMDLLMHFPYIGLHDEFENIVESRARSLVIEQNEIYDFLYAFHVNNGNMRKASVAMYEQAMRFQLESSSIESMKKRCASLLICINALHLIDERYRWIAKPVLGEDYQVTKHDNETDITDDVLNPKVIVLEVTDIQKELLHTEALVLLVQHRLDLPSFSNAEPEELTMILAGCKLFTAALKLAKGFDITLIPIFKSLAAACVRTSDEDYNESWSWLQENDLADLPHRNKASDMAWSLLQKVVEEHELPHSTQLRKSVVSKLLGLNAFVPQWLYNSYKLANCSELLFLYVRHSRLSEAASLAQEMISGMLGSGYGYFSFKHSIAITYPEMCLPLNTLDLLLYGLKQNKQESVEYKKMAVDLEELLQKYVSTALRTADDKIQIDLQANRIHSS